MKLLKLFLAGGASLLAMTAHARADFIITPIAFALFAGPLGGVFSFAAIYTGIQLAAYAAVLGAQFALSQRGQQKIDPGEAKTTYQEAESSEVRAVGRVRLGGLKAFGNTKRDKIYRLIWHSRGQAAGIENYHVGGREVTVDPGGAVSSPPWAASWGSWMRIETKAGDGSEAAWPELMSQFPSLWTPAHRCRGVFQSLVRFQTPDLDSEGGNKKFQKLYQGGAPDIEITARVGVVYDPRDPAQDPNEEATWKWTDNGILCAVHIMRAYPDLTAADFDWAFIADEADRADAVVATKGGTEPRARCWGVWLSESKRGEVMQQVLDSIGSEVIMSETGLIRLRLIDDAPQPEMMLPSLHQYELALKSGPEAVERPNVCRIRYYSPERGYDMAEINLTGMAWARVEDEIARYGEKVFDIDLPFCPSASQAQRIGRRLFMQARADSGSMKTTQLGMAAWDRYYALVEDEDAEEQMLCRLASPREDRQSDSVDIPFIVWPQVLIDEPWNPATMEAAPPDPAPDMQFESDLDTPDVLATSVVQYPGGAYETRVKFSGVSGGATAEANYRTYTDGLPDLWLPMTEYSEHGHYGYVAANTVGKEADFRARWFNGEDEASYFSDVVNVPDMQIDNSAPPEPYLDVQVTPNGYGDFDFSIVAYTTAMNAVRFVLAANQAEITPGYDGNTRPGVTYNAGGTMTYGPSAQTVTITATAYSSNGTPSPVATFTYVIPQDPN